MAQTEKTSARRRAPQPASLVKLLSEANKSAAAGQKVVLSLWAYSNGWNTRFGNDVLEDVVIPRRTLMRRKAKREDLSPDETDRAMRLARIATHADRVFGSPERADHWMRTPNSKFSGQTPFALLKTDTGSALVDETLFQIEHGIFA
jgi:putative toxin-antitoxin system antitoxin component (TIGR02293 family)